MNIVAVIQARMGSTRLPGKVLIDIGGKTMLERCVERIQQSTHITKIVVATTNSESDTVIAQECERLEVRCFRGSEEDVLDRYYQAAKEVHADIVVRFTADCPLLDPAIIDRSITAFMKEQPDYASNVLERTYPRGLDTEVFSFNLLKRVWEEAKQKHEREHVTAHILEHPDAFTVLSIKEDTDNSGHRWTVDTPQDLALVRAVYAELNGRAAFGWKDVLQLLEKNPEIRKLNANVQQKSLRN